MSDVKRWREEIASAWLYREVADAESDRKVGQLFRDLAVAAERQAGIIAQSLAQKPPLFRPDPRSRLVAAIVRVLSPRRCRAILAASKIRGLSVYDSAVPVGHVMPKDVHDVGGRHRGGGRVRVDAVAA